MLELTEGRFAEDHAVACLTRLAAPSWRRLEQLLPRVGHAGAYFAFNGSSGAAPARSAGSFEAVGQAQLTPDLDNEGYALSDVQVAQAAQFARFTERAALAGGAGAAGRAAAVAVLVDPDAAMAIYARTRDGGRAGVARHPLHGPLLHGALDLDQGEDGNLFMADLIYGNNIDKYRKHMIAVVVHGPGGPKDVGRTRAEEIKLLEDRGVACEVIKLAGQDVGLWMVTALALPAGVIPLWHKIAVQRALDKLLALPSDTT